MSLSSSMGIISETFISHTSVGYLFCTTTVALMRTTLIKIISLEYHTPPVTHESQSLVLHNISIHIDNQQR